MTPQILCENVSVQYDRHLAVQNATFSVEPGDFLCIVGENGSGKSTLLKAMLGLLPLSGGQILFPDSRSRRGIGYVPQQSNIQKNFPATVWEIVLSGCLPRRKWRPFYTAADKQRAQDALSRVDMLSLKNISYQHLSSGQQQRVLLARALCATDWLLCLDEPTTALDAQSTAELYALLANLCQNGLSIVMVSHDIPATLSQAKHILHMHTKPLFFGTTQAYCKTPLCQSFLKEVPHD